MNRKERRQLPKDTPIQKVPTYNMTREALTNNALLVAEKVKVQYESLILENEQIYQKNIDEMIMAVCNIFLIQLHDKFGFGSKRLHKVLDAVQVQIADINAGRLTIEDVILAVTEDTGIIIKEEN